MIELEKPLADHRAAVDEFIAAARAVDAVRWTAPRAPGAWSPAQIAEHLAIFYEYSRRTAQDALPSPIPRLIRPLVQRLARKMIVENSLAAGRYTRKGRAPAIFQPSATPGPAAEVLARLDAAVRGLEADVRARPPDRRERIDHPIFGAISTIEWLRVQAIHARHHRAQLMG